MATTLPIRDKRKLDQFKKYYAEKDRNIRNYTLIIVGLNTALRINDILHLTCDMVYQDKKVKKYIVLKERKTGKENKIFLNATIRNALKEYYQYLVESKEYLEGNRFLFPSPYKRGIPLSRSQAYRIICKAAHEVGLGEQISCHSLRKTFGYHAWKQGNDPMVIMLIYNHSSLDITKRYLCIDQDAKDHIFEEIRI